MKICENGIYREMTAEEIAEYQAAALEREKTPEPLTNERKIELLLDTIATAPTERKIELLLDTIATAPTPTVEQKVGYKWQPMYTSTAGLSWELVEDPTALGTMRNPLYWLTGRAVKMGYHYTDGTTVYVALADGIPTGFNDATFFAEV